MRIHSSSPRPFEDDLVWVLVFFLTGLVGVALRLDGIQSSLWLDEFGTLWATEGSLRMTINRASSFHGQTPLYYVLVWLGLRTCGETEFCLRAPSILFGIGTWATLFFAAREFLGRGAGRYAFILAAFDPTLVSMSANARPYSLALFFLAVALVGFSGAWRDGQRSGRWLWVLGAVGTAWTHYLMFPIVMGLILGYIFLPACRGAYARSDFRNDLLIQVGLILPALPQLFNIMGRWGSLAWIDTPHHWSPVFLAFPYLVALGVGVTMGSRTDPRTQCLRQLLWASFLFTLLIFEALFFAGVNLLHPRYMQGLLIPVLFLSAWTLALLKGRSQRIALVWALVMAGALLMVAKNDAGAFTGLEQQGWRDAVATLRSEVGNSSSTTVFFRSGFVEEDASPLGSPTAATRAPLRSPGEEPPKWKIISLTYRWDSGARESYFYRTIRPVIEDSDGFYLLSPGGYSEHFIAWVTETWPDQFRYERREFQRIHLVRFNREF